MLLRCFHSCEKKHVLCCFFSLRTHGISSHWWGLEIQENPYKKTHPNPLPNWRVQSLILRSFWTFSIPKTSQKSHDGQPPQLTNRWFLGFRFVLVFFSTFGSRPRPFYWPCSLPVGYPQRSQRRGLERQTAGRRWWQIFGSKTLRVVVQTHRIHVNGVFYLHEWLICMANV